MTDDPRPHVFATGKTEEPPSPPSDEDLGPEVWRQTGPDGTEAVGGTVGDDGDDADDQPPITPPTGE